MKRLSWIILIAYTLFLFKLAIFRLPLTTLLLNLSNFDLIKAHFFQGNFTPFHTIWLYYSSPHLSLMNKAINLIGNVVVFVPYGLLLPMLIKRQFTFIFFASFSISLFIEVVQTLTVQGRFDVDDLILNTAGGILGYFLYSIFNKFFSGH